MEYNNLKEIIKDMEDSKLSFLHIEFSDGTKISMKKDQSDALQECTNIRENGHENKVQEKSEEIVNCEDEVNYKYITSPMVGTFYSKPSPNEDSFVKVGGKVKAGDTTCIIEAMKLMNEIESEFDGEVVEILKCDGDPVGYGDKLIKIK